MEATLETLAFVKGLIASEKEQTPEEHLPRKSVAIRIGVLEELFESAAKFFAVGERMIDTEARMLKAIASSQSTAEDVMAARAAQKADMKTLAKIRAEAADQEASIASREALLGTRIALKTELVEMTKQRDQREELVLKLTKELTDLRGEVAAAKRRLEDLIKADAENSRS